MTYDFEPLQEVASGESQMEQPPMADNLGVSEHPVC